RGSRVVIPVLLRPGRGRERRHENGRVSAGAFSTFFSSCFGGHGRQWTRPTVDTTDDSSPTVPSELDVAATHGPIPCDDGRAARLEFGAVCWCESGGAYRNGFSADKHSDG